MSMVLTPQQRARSLFAIVACISVVGASIGISIPLMASVLERQGVPGWLIGANSMMPALATLMLTPFIPKMLERVSVRAILYGSILLGALCVPLFYLTMNVWAWFPLRFLFGIAMTGLFVLSEFWVNQIADDENRGKTIAVYGICLSIGFATGPAVLAMVGTEGPLPFMMILGFILLAGVPILQAGGLSPNIEDEKPAAVLSFITVAPAATLAALVFGMLETNVLQFLPIYSQRSLLSPETGPLLLTAFGAGNVLLQFPIGMLADRINRRYVLLLCATSGLICTSLIPVVTQNETLLLGTVFLFGGTVTGLYTVGLTMLGDRFKGAELAAANSAYVMLYSLGALISPPFAGIAIDTWNPQGLPYFLASICVFYLLIVGIRTWQNRDS